MYFYNHKNLIMLHFFGLNPPFRTLNLRQQSSHLLSIQCIFLEGVLYSSLFLVLTLTIGYWQSSVSDQQYCSSIIFLTIFFKSRLLCSICSIIDSHRSPLSPPNNSFTLCSCYGLLLIKPSNFYLNQSSEIHFLEGEYVVLLPINRISSYFPNSQEFGVQNLDQVCENGVSLVAFSSGLLERVWWSWVGWVQTLAMKSLMEWALISFLAKQSQSSLISSFLVYFPIFLLPFFDIFYSSFILGNKLFDFINSIGSNDGDFNSLFLMLESEEDLCPKNLRLNQRSKGPQILLRVCDFGNIYQCILSFIVLKRVIGLILM